MKILIGTDLVEIKRFKRKLAEAPLILANLFTSTELQNKEPTHLAGIFAAKEAVIKALGSKSGSWLEMEICCFKNGKPLLKFPKNLEMKLASYELSITHDGNYALAIFVAIKK